MNDFIILILVGLLAGFVSGGIGVGGGVVIVPALVFIMGFTQHQAQGTSLAVMIAPIGLISAYNYYRYGYVNVKFALILLITFFIGTYFGSLTAVHLPDKILKKAFGAILLITSLRMIFNK